MASTEQLIQQVRFALETLRERNGHHEFELICFGVARRRIASNLLPATGPVSSGGDQGRDAESHWTNLPNEAGTNSAFVSLATTEDVVMACTMQRDNVAGKIRHDLRSICKVGPPVARVVYFTASPLPMSSRHSLQQGAQRDHNVALDVWDAQALAHALAEPDLFHLAVQYLHVASELAPHEEKTELAGVSLAEVTDPFAAEVHRPVVVDGAEGLPLLPPYVRRLHDERLANIVEAALDGRSGMMILVAGSSSGKTRACWEALARLRRTGEWRFWHPIDPTRAAAVLDAVHRVGPRTVVWLNEAQQYLIGSGDSGERVAAKLRSLLADPNRAPVLVRQPHFGDLGWSGG